jgi:hypothetical protein
MLSTPSPTGDLDPTTIRRFHSRDTWLDFDRHFAGLPELVACDGCDEGIVQRIVDDYADDTGASYAPVNGCSTIVEPIDRDGVVTLIRDWYCPACTEPTSTRSGRTLVAALRSTVLIALAAIVLLACRAPETPLDRATATCVNAQAEGRLIYPLARCINAELLNPEDD